LTGAMVIPQKNIPTVPISLGLAYCPMKMLFEIAFDVS